MGALSNQEAASGWTDEIVIGWEDFSVANIGTIADDTAYTFTYTIPLGSVVHNCGAELLEAFNDSGGSLKLNVIVGDGDDDNGYLTTAALHTDQTEITKVVNTGALLATASKAYAAADTIDIKFSIAGASYTVNELNAGRVAFRFTIVSV
jgi:hypothetical protein